jgi:hypothetical protein
MIVFKLKCAADHEFEAWFRDGGTFDRQSARGLITCPDCGSADVEKAPMAPRLGRSRAAEAAPAETRPAGKQPAPPELTPPQLRLMLQQIRRHVEANCEYVGEKFAAEARRIHKGEADARGIYGEASEEESRDLSDEGIEVARIPWVPPTDA